jgi:hypothetical protein
MEKQAQLKGTQLKISVSPLPMSGESALNQGYQDYTLPN